MNESKSSSSPLHNKEKYCEEDKWSESTDDELSLDRSLHRKAKKINLSKRNVKSIIHHLLTNEHVIKLYKDVLNAVGDDKSQEGSGPSSTMKSLDDFPKMTRSKVKDFMEKSNIPASPAKLQKPGPSILDVHFAEEEDDDEYSPDKDENNETDDDESVVSSYLSEFGSPCPVTPSTPVSQIPPDRPPLSLSPSIGSPLTNPAAKLKIDLSSCDLSEAEDEGTIALRTRSKKSLTETSLIDIEQAFVAPDITPDLYDTCYADEEWVDFLNSLYKTSNDESYVDDEANDPEFNYIAEAEQEALDDEDFRFDKPAKVTKKELNSLIEELHCLFEDEVLPLQVVAEASNTQDHISQLVVSNVKETPTPPQLNNAQTVQMPQQTVELFSNQTPTGSSTSCFSKISPVGSLSSSQAVSSDTQFSYSNSGFKVPYPPCEAQSLSPLAAEERSTETESILTSTQISLVKDNMRKHIQLLAQTFVLSNVIEPQEQRCKIANAVKNMLVNLHQQKCESKSLYDVCNLDEAIQLISKESVFSVENNLPVRCGMKVKSLKQIELKMTFFNSPVFLYPHLLPHFEKNVNSGKKTRSKAMPSNTRGKFLPSEDNLIALGLEQFSDCQGAFPSEFIHKYLICCKSVNDIYHRIKFLSSSKAGINHVKKLLKLKLPVQLDPPPLHLVDFRAPRLKDLPELPEWCQELAKAESSSAQNNSSTPVLPPKKKESVKRSNDLIELLPKSSENLIFPLTEIQLKRPSSPSVITVKVSSSRPGSSQEGGKNPQTVDVPSSVSHETSMDKSNLQDLSTISSEMLGSPNASSLPIPSSSSTPVPKVKHPSVKNLSSAFEESEKVELKTKKNEGDVLEVNSGVELQLSSDQSKAEPSLRSNVNNANNSNTNNVSPILPEKVSSTHPFGPELSLQEKTAKVSKRPPEVQTFVETPSVANSEKSKNEEVIDSGKIKQPRPLLSSKRIIKKLTVIEKPTFSRVKKTSARNVCEDSEVNNDQVKIDISKKVSVSNVVQKMVLMDSSKEIPDASPNKLVPWISSIISQFESKEPDKKFKNTKSTVLIKVTDTVDKGNECGDLNTDYTDISSELFKSPKSSPMKVALFSPPKASRTPTKYHTIAPKSSPNTKSAPYVPIPRVSPKRKELNRQVRHILPKSFVFETKIPSPTKTTALNLKKKAALLCQKSPVKILPLPAGVEPKEVQATGLRRSQRRKDKIKKKEAPCPKVVKRVKKMEVDNETAKETESETSEVEESGQSQEEDEDREKLDDLMAASTTISFGSKHVTKLPDEDVKTKAERRKAMSLSLLQPDLVEADPKKDDRDTAFAQQYFNQVKETLSTDPERFYKFLSLLKDLNNDHANPVELYLDIVTLLSDHQQLVEDFAGFLLSFQAVECQCFSTNFQYNQIRQFLRQVEVHSGSTNTYQKVLRALATWSSMSQEGKLEGSLRDKMVAILKNVPGVLDNLISYFLDGNVSECHSMDFEDVYLDDQAEAEDEFETVILPDKQENYNTKTCSCQCHNNPQDEKFFRRNKHCISCSLQIYEGQPVLKMSRNEMRKMAVVYPSEEQAEKDLLIKAKAKKEAAQIALAKAKGQQQQRGKKRKKELKGQSQKKMAVTSVVAAEISSDPLSEVGVESKQVKKCKELKKESKPKAAKTKLKGVDANIKSKTSGKSGRPATNKKRNIKQEQTNKTFKASANSSKSTKSQSKQSSHTNDQTSKSSKSRSSDNETEKTKSLSSDQASKSSKSRSSDNETEECKSLSLEKKSTDNESGTGSEMSASSQGDEQSTERPEENLKMKNTGESVSSSELFDRLILDNLSYEGLTEAALNSIHDKFPDSSKKSIQERAKQLLSLLETMSDASTDEDGATGP